MRPIPTVSFVILSVLAAVPGWTGEERLPVMGPPARMEATRVVLDRRDPTRTRVGALTFLGGVALTGSAPGFGGFSSLSVRGDRFTLLSDGGNIVGFRMGADWQLHDLTFAALPSGPGTGWQKSDRDSESMAVLPSGDILVGFESANAIWRYSPGFRRAEAVATPAAMAKWPANGGPETLVRRRDGSVLTIGETAQPLQGQGQGQGQGAHGRGRGRQGIVFAHDPTSGPTRGYRFTFVPPRHYDPSDATELPDGRLLVLTRAFALPFDFSNRLLLIDRGAIRQGARIAGREIAVLAAPLIHDNFEGVAATIEHGATIVWLVSDDNQFPLQRSLLLKFRLNA